VILDRPRKRSRWPGVAPPGGLGGFGSLASLLLGSQTAAGMLPTSRLASGTNPLQQNRNLISAQTLSARLKWSGDRFGFGPILGAQRLRKQQRRQHQLPIAYRLLTGVGVMEPCTPGGQ
jgi:hypothetical protein